MKRTGLYNGLLSGYDCIFNHDFHELKAWFVYGLSPINEGEISGYCAEWEDLSREQNNLINSIGGEQPSIETDSLYFNSAPRYLNFEDGEKATNYFNNGRTTIGGITKFESVFPADPFFGFIYYTNPYYRGISLTLNGALNLNMCHDYYNIPVWFSETFSWPYAATDIIAWAISIKNGEIRLYTSKISDWPYSNNPKDWYFEETIKQIGTFGPANSPPTLNILNLHEFNRNHYYNYGTVAQKLSNILSIGSVYTNTGRSANPLQMHFHEFFISDKFFIKEDFEKWKRQIKHISKQLN